MAAPSSRRMDSMRKAAFRSISALACAISASASSSILRRRSARARPYAYKSGRSPFGRVRGNSAAAGKAWNQTPYSYRTSAESSACLHADENPDGILTPASSAWASPRVAGRFPHPQDRAADRQSIASKPSPRIVRQPPMSIAKLLLVQAGEEIVGQIDAAVHEKTLGDNC